MKAKIVSYFCIILVALFSVIGVILFNGKYFKMFTFLSVICTCIPFLVTFENKKTTTRYVVLVAILTAFSVAGRFLFAPIPFFKPVSAIVIISGMSLGTNAGFVVGAMSAVVSNFYFGQGAWTPFQMLAWGLIGLGAGLLANQLKNKIFLSVYGVISGFAYSVIMDIWSTIFLDGNFNFNRFSVFFVTSLPVTICYMISNVLFLILIGKPLLETLERVTKKYGILPFN